MKKYAKKIMRKLKNGTAKVGVIGLGYVGLPLAVICAQAGFHTTGFDIDLKKIKKLSKGKSYIDSVDGETVYRLFEAVKFNPVSDFERLKFCDAIVICVPTPLTRDSKPDLSFIKHTCLTIAKYLRLGQLISLESTTYPGTTADIVRPILERTGLQSGKDFFWGTHQSDKIREI